VNDSIYSRLVAAGCQIDSHESDLYVKASPEALAVIRQFEAEGGVTHRKRFTSQIDGTEWYDLPFAFDPFWAKKSV
jgi:hypothetical protein